MRINIAGILFLTALLLSCGEIKTAQIWTDRPELAVYCEYFNTIQNKYKVSVKYFEFPAMELEKSNNIPDIIVGSWLKNSHTGLYFNSIDSIFGAKKLSRSVFYPKLLAIGKIQRNQYLLPVSFNIPALIFSKDRDQDISNSFTIDFNDIKTLGKDYNVESRGAYTRMGFSPSWDNNFLFTVAVLSGASFSEASPVTWDSNALENSIDEIYRWTREINSNYQAEEDFIFKYFFEPPEKLIQSKRILFWYMDSRDLFTLSNDNMKNLDFRWVIENENVPINEDMVFLGIPKKAKSRKAARVFIQWFFRTGTQHTLMEYCRKNRINENVFGICGGFSALSSVTEQIFPLFYPELLGRMPPSENFMPPNMLPANWVAIKERVILPYLNDRAHSERTEDIYPLEKRLSDWMRTNK
ncbi:MAG: hypothetical protein LBC76_04310 [Treponema sp.]|jgi:ABC-type glycerol-3-phosphate transport system substrate-binding protein|nr:hypothetical protein [Treponema sp.]